jgi:hypothetical protein
VHRSAAASSICLSRPRGSEHPDQLMEALELFGKKVLPHVRDI